MSSNVIHATALFNRRCASHTEQAATPTLADHERALLAFEQKLLHRSADQARADAALERVCVPSHGSSGPRSA